MISTSEYCGKHPLVKIHNNPCKNALKSVHCLNSSYESGSCNEMVANLYFNSLQVSKSLETNFASFESGNWGSIL